jgi:hypothetical protein
METSSNNQKYYLHFNGERQGPFTIKEIEENEVEINSDTLVWTKGMKEWDKAENIKDFENLINSHLPPNIPFENNDIDPEDIPPIPTYIPKTDSDKSSEEDTKKSTEAPNQESTSQNNFNNPDQTTKTNSQDFELHPERNANNSEKKAIIIVFAIVAVLSLLFYFLSVNARNKKNEAQLQLQQQIIEDHQEKIQAQQLAERQNKIKQLNEIIATLKIERDDALVYLKSSEIELNDLQQFKFLRTASEKSSQIRTQLSMIQGWEAEVNRLNNEIQKFQREIEQLRY